MKNYVGHKIMQTPSHENVLNNQDVTWAPRGIILNHIINGDGYQYDFFNKSHKVSESGTAWIYELPSNSKDIRVLGDNCDLMDNGDSHFISSQVEEIDHDNDLYELHSHMILDMCSDMDYQFFEDFNNYAHADQDGDTNLPVPGWSVVQGGVSPHIYKSNLHSHSKPYCLRFNNLCTYAMPELDLPDGVHIRDLKLSMYIKITNSTYRLSIGVWSNNTFTTISTFNYSEYSEMNLAEVDFSSYLGSDANAKIAFKNHLSSGSSTYSTIYVDDIKISISNLSTSIASHIDAGDDVSYYNESVEDIINSIDSGSIIRFAVLYNMYYYAHSAKTVNYDGTYHFWKTAVDNSVDELSREWSQYDQTGQIVQEGSPHIAITDFPEYAQGYINYHPKYYINHPGLIFDCFKRCPGESYIIRSHNIFDQKREYEVDRAQLEYILKGNHYGLYSVFAMQNNIDHFFNCMEELEHHFSSDNNVSQRYGWPFYEIRANDYVYQSDQYFMHNQGSNKWIDPQSGAEYDTESLYYEIEEETYPGEDDMVIDPDNPDHWVPAGDLIDSYTTAILKEYDNDAPEDAEVFAIDTPLNYPVFVMEIDNFNKNRSIMPYIHNGIPQGELIFSSNTRKLSITIKWDDYYCRTDRPNSLNLDLFYTTSNGDLYYYNTINICQENRRSSLEWYKEIYVGTEENITWYILEVDAIGKITNTQYGITYSSSDNISGVTYGEFVNGYITITNKLDISYSGLVPVHMVKSWVGVDENCIVCHAGASLSITAGGQTYNVNIQDMYTPSTINLPYNTINPGLNITEINVLEGYTYVIQHSDDCLTWIVVNIKDTGGGSGGTETPVDPSGVGDIFYFETDEACYNALKNTNVQGFAIQGGWGQFKGVSYENDKPDVWHWRGWDENLCYKIVYYKDEFAGPDPELKGDPSAYAEFLNKGWYPYWEYAPLYQYMRDFQFNHDYIFDTINSTIPFDFGLFVPFTEEMMLDGIKKVRIYICRTTHSSAAKIHLSRYEEGDKSYGFKICTVIKDNNGYTCADLDTTNYSPTKPFGLSGNSTDPDGTEEPVTSNGRVLPVRCGGYLCSLFGGIDAGNTSSIPKFQLYEANKNTESEFELNNVWMHLLTLMLAPRIVNTMLRYVYWGDFIKAGAYFAGSRIDSDFLDFSKFKDLEFRLYGGALLSKRRMLSMGPGQRYRYDKMKTNAGPDDDLNIIMLPLGFFVGNIVDSWEINYSKYDKKTIGRDYDRLFIHMENLVDAGQLTIFPAVHDLQYHRTFMNTGIGNPVAGGFKKLNNNIQEDGAPLWVFDRTHEHPEYRVFAPYKDMYRDCIHLKTINNNTILLPTDPTDYDKYWNGSYMGMHYYDCMFKSSGLRTIEDPLTGKFKIKLPIENLVPWGAFKSMFEGCGELTIANNSLIYSNKPGIEYGPSAFRRMFAFAGSSDASGGIRFQMPSLASTAGEFSFSQMYLRAVGKYDHDSVAVCSLLPAHLKPGAYNNMFRYSSRFTKINIGVLGNNFKKDSFTGMLYYGNGVNVIDTGMITKWNPNGIVDTFNNWNYHIKGWDDTSTTPTTGNREFIKHKKLNKTFNRHRIPAKGKKWYVTNEYGN